MGVFVTTVTFLKSMIGPTLLYVPCMYLEAGFAIAAGGLLLSAVLSTVGMLKLISIRDTIPASEATYPQVAQVALGRTGYLAVEACLVTSQWLYCVGYPIFAAQNLQAVLASFMSSPPSVAAMIALQLPLIVPYCWIRQIQRLGNAMVVANLFIWSSLCVVIALLAVQLEGHGTKPVELAKLELSTVLFVGQVTDMKRPCNRHVTAM